MEIIKLSKSIIINGVEVKEVEMDFSKVTGQDIINTEAEARAMGDQSPSAFLSMRYQTALAAKIIGVTYDDLVALPAEDFKNIVVPVASFLLS